MRAALRMRGHEKRSFCRAFIIKDERFFVKDLKVRIKNIFKNLQCAFLKILKLF